MNKLTTTEEIKFDERGLVPAVVQDARTREVLTLAYMNRESLARTAETGETWFWSRSREELWHKGATSGHTQRVKGLRADCDGDALVVLVEPAGPACHTGERSCFHQRIGGAGDKVRDDDGDDETSELGDVLRELHATVEARRREMPAKSYTTYLFEQGLDKILKKLGEETTETVIAAKNEDKAALVAETSDLLYHLVVLLVERGVGLDEIARVLKNRSGGGSR